VSVAENVDLAVADLPTIIEAARRGIATVVAVEGRPAVRIEPIAEPAMTAARSVSDILDTLAAIRARGRAEPESAADLIREGRRWAE
jgi:antitoxin (DNA-binding transcriptional repressor) of toxin-antitoxin stability system